MKNKYIFTVLCWLMSLSVTSAQTIEIPQKVQFADLELILDESARTVIGQKTKYLTGDFLRYQNYQEYGRMYFPFVEEAMRKYHIPDDFKYLILLESNHLTHSPLDGLLRPGSDGFWQMRTSEAQALKLVINEDIDERNHVILASDVLMKFFAENNELLDNWVHTLLTKELGFTQTGEVIDKGLAGKKTMNITKENHVFILNFLAHYITFKNKINPDPKAIKLIVYQGEIGEKIQETSQKIALSENITEYNLWNINPDKKLVKSYPIILPIMPDEEQKAKSFLGDRIVKRKYAPTEDKLDESSEKEEVTKDSVPKTEDKIDKNIVENLDTASEKSTEIQIQKNGDFPVLKNQEKKEINGKIFVFVEANSLPAIIAQEGQSATDLAKAGNLSDAKFLKYNEIIDKNLQVGTVYYLKKKNTKGATQSHVLQESEDLTDVSQMYGIRKSNLLVYNALGDNSKFIKYQEVKTNDTEIMGEKVMEDDSVFVGGRVLNLQAKLTGNPLFKVLRKIKKTPQPQPQPLVILEATADAPILGNAEIEIQSIAETVTDSSSENKKELVVENQDSGVIKSASDSSESTKIVYEKKPITSDYYVAQPNDTWSGIAYMFSIKQSDLYLWNGAHPEKILYVHQKVRLTQPPALPKPDEYVVLEGESLAQIATRYGTSVDAIIKRNMLLTKKLPAGCKIYLGEPKTPTGWHTVKPKETFFSIARLYGISFRDLLAWNNMTLESKIFKGSKLALESGLLKETEPKNSVVQTAQDAGVSSQKIEINSKDNSSESTIYESTAEPTNIQRTALPDIADPATLTMLITKKPQAENATKPEKAQGDPNIYEVKNESENIYEIASTVGVKTSDLKKWNDLPSGVMDFPKGTKLRITSPEPAEQVTDHQEISSVQETKSEQKTEAKTEINTAQNQEVTAEDPVQIATDANGNDPAHLTALILQKKLETQRQNSEQKTESKTEQQPVEEAPKESAKSENTNMQAKNLDASYYHEVAFGDPLESILEKYGITETQLKQWNPDHADAIETSSFWGGEKLIIKDPNK